MASVTEQLWDRIDPFVAAEGIELDDVEILGGGQIVRVVLDAPAEAPDSFDVDRIADLARGISRIIDADDPFPGAYTLEVSSPGLERKLTRKRHYDKSVGRKVRIKTFRPIDDIKIHEGTLVGADETVCIVDCDGEQRTIPFDNIAAAKTVFEWEKGAKPGKNA